VFENRSALGPKLKNNPWIGSFRPNGAASLTLFCLPYAGGTNVVFKNWESLMPKWIDVCPIHLPGRAVRLSETPYRSVGPLAGALGEALLPYLGKPYVFFGHSMGALISFELARLYRKKQVAAPIHIYTSGRAAPHLPDPDPPTFDLPDDEFVEELRRLNGTPSDVLANHELVQLMMPALRADFELCQTYKYEDDVPLDCPISAFGGLSDVDVPRTSVEAWRVHTSRDFMIRMMPGDHFFLHFHERTIVQTIIRDLYRSFAGSGAARTV